jgi:hypothetical protein
MASFMSGLAATSLFLVGLLFGSACGGPVAPSRASESAAAAKSALTATLGEALVDDTEVKVRCAADRREIAAAAPLVTVAAATATAATIALPAAVPAGAWCAVTVEAKAAALADVMARALPLTANAGLLLASEAIHVGAAAPARIGLTRLFLPMRPVDPATPGASPSPQPSAPARPSDAFVQASVDGPAAPSAKPTKPATGDTLAVSRFDDAPRPR